MTHPVKKTMVTYFEELTDLKDQGQISEDVFNQLAKHAYAKTRSSAGTGTPRQVTFLKDVAGETVAILDYYFKRWMPLVGPEAVEFGSKASSATGLNNMSKEGVSLWTKQQRVKKAETAALLEQVEKGEIQIEDLAAEREAIEERARHISPTEMGFETKEEVISYLQDQGVELEADSEA